MKLLRYGPKGQEKPGILDGDGIIRDLSSIISDFTPATVTPESLERLSRLNLQQLPAISGKPRLGTPVIGMQKFIAVGLNYTDHAAELNMELPGEPVLFTKHLNCLNGPDDNIELPEGSVKSDWEVELGFIIGTRAKNISESDSLSHIAGYTIVNDVSERAFQLEHGGQWMKGKSCDTFGPVGPWMVTTDEIGDPQQLQLFTEVNGQLVQNGTTANMIFSVSFLVAYISRFMTLEPGDIVCTGTPAGVGVGRKPQMFLKPGDHMRLGISGLGEQNQRVVAA